MNNVDIEHRSFGAKLANGNPLLWYLGKDHAKGTGGLIRQWDNCLQEKGPGESLVCGVSVEACFPSVDGFLYGSFCGCAQQSSDFLVSILVEIC
jgi:hypothetical protein